MKLPLATAGLLLLAVACGSSHDLATSFARVATQMSRAQIEDILGKPERSDVAVLPREPFFGPQESLAGVLEPGASYEEWEYTDDETVYLVWFGGAAEQREGWTVIAKSSYPKDAVF